MHHQINKSLYKNIPFCLQLTSGSAPFSKKNETKGAALTDTACNQWVALRTGHHVNTGSSLYQHDHDGGYIRVYEMCAVVTPNTFVYQVCQRRTASGV